jgi:hypothetical protein
MSVPPACCQRRRRSDKGAGSAITTRERSGWRRLTRLPHRAGIARVAEGEQIGQARRARSVVAAGKPGDTQGRHQRIVVGDHCRLEARIERPPAPLPRGRNRHCTDTVAAVGPVLVDPLPQQTLLDAARRVEQKDHPLADGVRPPLVAPFWQHTIHGRCLTLSSSGAQRQR